MRVFSPAFAAVAFLPTIVLAHDGDIGIRVVGGQFETILASGEPPTQTFGAEIERVFAAELEWNAVTGDVRIDEPGIASEDSALSGRNLGFNVRAALRQWNGSGFSSTPLTMSVGSDDLALPFIATPPSNVVIAGHTITVPSLPLDFHYDWRLDGASQSLGTGVYLVELELTNPGGTLAASDPFWVVFNWGQDETEHEAAIDWTVQNLVPSPSAALVFALFPLARRRRR